MAIARICSSIRGCNVFQIHHFFIYYLLPKYFIKIGLPRRPFGPLWCSLYGKGRRSLDLVSLALNRFYKIRSWFPSILNT